jgi:MerR family transcriptional regulator, thiopeptide resistance regulator
MSECLLKVGELAERTGLTVRTLHYYEEIGLLVPSHRSGAGHRLYTADDVGKLHRIALLRGLGLTLEQVAGALLMQEPTPLLALVERHLQAVEARIAEQAQIRGRLVALVSRLRDGDEVGIDRLIDSIEVMTMIERYYSEEQLATLRARAEAMGPEAMRAAQQGWQELFKEVRAAIDRGAAPGDADVQELAGRWRGLIEAFTGGDAGVRRSLQAMYSENPEMKTRGGGDPEVHAFMQRALAVRGA